MDFVFGKLISDELKLTYHRASRPGVQHLHRITPADPSPPDAVTVQVVTSGDFHIQRVALYYTTDGSIPQASRGKSNNATNVEFECVGTEWDTLV